MGFKVVLTADRGSFTTYSGISTLGYVACMPARLVPRLLMNSVFTPPSKVIGGVEAEVAPYALRKVEASLLKQGIDSIAVVPPEYIEKAVDASTKVVGISVHDPLGLSPVSFKLTMLFGGGPSWTARFFEELGEKIIKLKKKFNFKVFVGGPATWQVELERPDWVDTIFYGEAELDLPQLVLKILNGETPPRAASGRNPKVSEIPVIAKPTRFGEVQVTRGCPRGCQFCSITPETFRTIPLDDVKHEVSLNIAHGQRSIELLTDDILLYGSQRLRTNHAAVVNLFEEVKKLGAEQIYFPHISAPAVLESPKTVEAIGEIAEYDKYRSEAPVVGLESGSERIIAKYMSGKPFPWKPEDWKSVILNATPIMNDAFITPCYTMTIGYQDETDEDVSQSIDLVTSIIDNKLRAWIFPLPVIPMGTSRIRHNPFPVLEKLPKKYWELLYIAWKYDLKITREMMPEMSKRVENRITSRIVNIMTDKIFSHIEDYFKMLMETNGIGSLEYSKINLNNVLGVLKSAYWLTRASLSPPAISDLAHGSNTSSATSQ
ncbi:MAG: radical SAM protein [Thermoplasmataceae archaeon]